MPKTFDEIVSTSQNNELVPLFDAKKPSKIKIGSLGEEGLANYKSIDLDEFATAENIVWTESIMLPESVQQTYKNIFPKKGIPEKLFNPDYTNLVIADMGGSLGKGVFLAPDAMPILKDTILAAYAGKYLSPTEAHIKDIAYIPYGFSVGQCELFSPNNNEEGGAIDAKQFGNIARYFQHLPTIQELIDNYTLDESLKEPVATQNINLGVATYQGCPVLYLISNQTIYPGQIIGLSYREKYWLGAYMTEKIRPQLFTKKGLIITPNLYSYKKVYLEFGDIEDQKGFFYEWPKEKAIEHISLDMPLYEIDKNLIYSISAVQLEQQVFDQLNSTEQVLLSEIKNARKNSSEDMAVIIYDLERLKLAYFAVTNIVIKSVIDLSTHYPKVELRHCIKFVAKCCQLYLSEAFQCEIAKMTGKDKKPDNEQQKSKIALQKKFTELVKEKLPFFAAYLDFLFLRAGAFQPNSINKFIEQAADKKLVSQIYSIFAEFNKTNLKQLKSIYRSLLDNFKNVVDEYNYVEKQLKQTAMVPSDVQTTDSWQKPSLTSLNSALIKANSFLAKQQQNPQNVQSAEKFPSKISAPSVQNKLIKK